MSATRTKKLDLTGVQVKSDFDKIIIHHTATKRMKKYGVEWCRDLHLGKKWHDIGYHIYIEYDGKIKMGRPLHKRGAHCLGQNTWAIGIAFVGGLDKDGEAACTLTDTQKKSIAVAIKALREHTGKLLPVYSHNEFRNTFCPGFDASLVDWEAELDDGARDTE
jgi:N-acetylmuramoyl-L-alanine amidase